VNYIINPPPQVSVAIRDRDSRFPVRRVYCVGRNYEAHAREMGRIRHANRRFCFRSQPMR